jgi:hypothetical protein
MKVLFEMLVVTGIFGLCRFIDWRERRERRYPAFEQDGAGPGLPTALPSAPGSCSHP